MTSRTIWPRSTEYASGLHDARYTLPSPRASRRRRRSEDAAAAGKVIRLENNDEVDALFADL
jgi:hypothetical protein